MEYINKNLIELLLGVSVLVGGYIKFKGAFTEAIREAMQPLQASLDKLSLVVDNLCKEMERQRTTLHDLELKVQEHETNIDNQHRRLKILEGYHKDRSGENA